MSKYGGSEKTTQAFVAAYNKPSVSTRSAQAEAPAGVLRSLLCLLIKSPLPSRPPASVLWPPPGLRVMWGGVYREDSPRWMLQDPRHHTGPPLPPLVAPTKSSSLCPLTLSPAQEQHAVFFFLVCTGSPCPSSSSFSFLAANHGDRIRLFRGVVNVLIM